MNAELSILVVDDERYAVEGIKAGVNWASLHIDKVYTAYSVSQATELILHNKIDIILCDIEMPQQSGLDLLKWVVDNRIDAICVLLTAFANFDYAKTALKLGTFDYILKPVSYELLANTIKKSIDELMSRRIREKNAENWVTSKHMLLESFIGDLVSGIIPSIPARIQQEIKRCHLDLACLEDEITPIMIEFINRDKTTIWDIPLFEYGLRNILNEIIDSCHDEVTLCRFDEYVYIVVFSSTTQTGNETWSDIIECCGSVFNMDINCFLGSQTHLIGLKKETDRLENARINNLKKNTIIYPDTQLPINNTPSLQKAFSRWSNLFLNYFFIDAKAEIIGLLDLLAHDKRLNSATLQRIYRFILYQIHAVMDRHNLPFDSFWQNTDFEALSAQATSDAYGLVEWLNCSIKQLSTYFSGLHNRNEAVVDAKKYIFEHMGEPISRSKIASAVCLSPDHLSRIFKSETGQTLTEYILEQKMYFAKERLINTNNSIVSIAMEAGYYNLPYFSMLFRRQFGMTPTTFRNRIRKNMSIHE